MNKISGIVTYAGAVVVAFLALMTCADVLGRFLLNRPFLGVYEVTENVLVIIGALGVAASTIKDEHISVDTLYERLSPLGKRGVKLFGALLGLVIYGILLWQGIVAVNESIVTAYEVTRLLSLPVYPVRILLGVGFLISLLAVVYQIVEITQGRVQKTGESAPPVE